MNKVAAAHLADDQELVAAMMAEMKVRGTAIARNAAAAAQPTLWPYTPHIPRMPQHTNARAPFPNTTAARRLPASALLSSAVPTTPAPHRCTRAHARTPAHTHAR